MLASVNTRNPIPLGHLAVNINAKAAPAQRVADALLAVARVLLPRVAPFELTVESPEIGLQRRRELFAESVETLEQCIQVGVTDRLTIDMNSLVDVLQVWACVFADAIASGTKDGCNQPNRAAFPIRARHMDHGYGLVW